MTSWSAIDWLALALGVVAAVSNGFWAIAYWLRGRRLTDANERACLLQNEVDRLTRLRDGDADRARREMLDDSSLLREFSRPGPDDGSPYGR